MDIVLLIGYDIPAMQEIKVWLSSQFSMNDLGESFLHPRDEDLLDRSKEAYGSVPVYVH